MIRIGLITERKIPADNRVALTPAQCKWLHKNSSAVRMVAQSSGVRCFSDREYSAAGVEVLEDMSGCDVLLGIKEVPVEWHYVETRRVNPIKDSLRGLFDIVQIRVNALRGRYK